MGDKKKGKKKDAKKLKGIFAGVDSVGQSITSAPSTIAGKIGTAAHATTDVAKDVGGDARHVVADTAKNTVGTAQAVIEKVQPDHPSKGKGKKKDKKANKKEKKK